MPGPQRLSEKSRRLEAPSQNGEAVSFYNPKGNATRERLPWVKAEEEANFNEVPSGWIHLKDRTISRGRTEAPR